MPLPKQTLNPDDEDDIGFEDPVEQALNRTPSPSLPGQVRTAEELAAAFPYQRRDLKCPDCGDKLVLKDGKYGIFYGCVKWNETGCKGAHNCHKGTAEPLGIPADSETRAVRKIAHEVFDSLWKDKGLSRLSRKAAYEWMQKNLGLREEDAHIAKLDKAGCEKLIQAVERFLHPPNRLDRIIDDDVI